jgi:hypothetical protein
VAVSRLLHLTTRDIGARWGARFRRSGWLFMPFSQPLQAGLSNAAPPALELGDGECLANAKLYFSTPGKLVIGQICVVGSAWGIRE